MTESPNTSRLLVVDQGVGKQRQWSREDVFLDGKHIGRIDRHDTGALGDPDPIVTWHPSDEPGRPVGPAESYADRDTALRHLLDAAGGAP